MSRYLIFILSTTFLLSCNNSRNTNDEVNKGIKSIEFPYLIDIEKNLGKVSTATARPIGKDLEYIPLETTPISMIGQIQQIELSSDFIFVSGSNKLLQFDQKGKFIRQIGAIGRGPGEYAHISRFCVDEKNEKIFINVMDTHTLLEYNYRGEFIRSSNLSWLSSQFLLYDTTGLVFDLAYDSDSTIHSKYNLYITDFEGNQKSKIKRHFIRKSNLDAGLVPFYYFNKTLHFKQYGIDTLYTFKVEKPEPYAIFNLGKWKMDPNLMFPFSNNEIDNMMRRIENNIWIKEISENETFIFSKIKFGLSDSVQLCLFNKRTTEVIMLGGSGLKNDIDGGVNFWPKIVYKDNILVDYCASYELLKNMHNKNLKELREKFGEKYDRLEKIISGLDEMSNPVIIILR